MTNLANTLPTSGRGQLVPGRVYRTKDLATWGKNASRLAGRLERQGVLERLAQGLFVHPRIGRFGSIPPDDEELMRGFLEGAPFVITGPERWNALGLGSTAVFATRMVYNTKRSGEFRLGGGRFLLRRVRFPAKPTPEWFAVDLLEHHDMAGVSLDTLAEGLARALKAGNLRFGTLRKEAREYATARIQELIEQAGSAAMMSA